MKLTLCECCSIKWEDAEIQNAHSDTSQQNPQKKKKNNMSRKPAYTTSKEPANMMNHVTLPTIKAQEDKPKKILPADTLKADIAFGKTNANFFT